MSKKMFISQYLFDCITKVAIDSNIYSTTEQVIGKWIDGKPVYRKTININTTSGTNTIPKNEITSDAIDKVLTIKGFTIQPSNNISTVPYYYGSNDFTNVYYNPNVGIYIRAGANYGYGNTYIIVEYTKQ